MNRTCVRVRSARPRSRRSSTAPGFVDVAVAMERIRYPILGHHPPMSMMLMAEILISAVLTTGAAQAPQPAAAPELYRFVLIQAAPGRLLDLIDLYKKRLPAIAGGGGRPPYHR